MTQLEQQKEFDAKYITANEICKSMNLTRASIYSAQKRGILPPPIVVYGSKTHVWVREEVQPNLDKWNNALQIRRGTLNEA